MKHYFYTIHGIHFRYMWRKLRQIAFPYLLLDMRASKSKYKHDETFILIKHWYKFYIYASFGLVVVR